MVTSVLTRNGKKRLIGQTMFKVKIKKRSNIATSITKYFNGKLHSEDGPAIEMWNSHWRHEEWYKNGELHRENGPAKDMWNKTKKWYLYGKLHRVDGPAVVWRQGHSEWWVNGYRFSYDEWTEINWENYV